MSSDLSDLIERVAAATGENDELDCRIVATLLSDKPVTFERSKINGAWCAYVEDFKGRPRLWDCPSPIRQNRAVTASVDAALALVERVMPGWCKSVVDLRPELCEGYVWERGHVGNIQGKAPTPALAIVLAMLRALEATRSDEKEKGS